MQITKLLSLLRKIEMGGNNLELEDTDGSTIKFALQANGDLSIEVSCHSCMGSVILTKDLAFLLTRWLNLLCGDKK
jgi:hypothetical protein